MPGYRVRQADRGDGYGGLAFFIPHSTVWRSYVPPPYQGGVLESLGIELSIAGKWITTILI